MMKKAYFASLTALLAIAIAYAQNPLEAFGQNAQSGALGTSLLNIFTSISGWSQIIEVALIFLIVGLAGKEGVKKIWPDSKRPGLIAAAFSGFVTLGYAMSGVSIGPYMIPVLAVISIGALIYAMTPKEKRNPVIILIIALLIVGAGMLAFKMIKPGSSLFEATTLGGSNLLPSRVIAGTPTGISNDPNVNYEMGQTALKEYDFENAQKYFALVVAAGAGTNNKHFTDASHYISIGGKGDDLLFKQMLQHYDKAIDAEISALQILYEQAAKYPEGSAERTRLLGDAEKLAEKIGVQRTDLCQELEKRNAPCAG